MMKKEAYDNFINQLWDRNAKVFADTRKKSKGAFKDATSSLLKHTMVYKDADDLVSDNDLVRNSKMKIDVILGGTASTAYSLQERTGEKVAMLNFADAKRPGGWVVDGAPTQEENLCRCTNLYETLIQKKCKENYYDMNIKFSVADADTHCVEPYLDALIYAENVTIFKDDETYEDISPRYVDVITCPSPCGVFNNVDNIMKHRIRGIIKSAYAHGAQHIVLGAWGCGAFMQNPKTVSRCFKEVLAEFPVFKSVIFAIKPTIGKYEDRTYKIFYNTFRPGTPLF